MRSREKNSNQNWEIKLNGITETRIKYLSKKFKEQQKIKIESNILTSFYIIILLYFIILF